MQTQPFTVRDSCHVPLTRLKSAYKKTAPSLHTCYLVSVLSSVYLDHLHVLPPGQVDAEQSVLLVPCDANHRHGGHCSPHEAAAINLRLDQNNLIIALGPHSSPPCKSGRHSQLFPGFSAV